MKIRPFIYVIIAVLFMIFSYVICSWTVFTTTKILEFPGEGVYTGQVKNGYFHGTGNWESVTGISYRGNFKNGFFDGLGTLIFPNGATFEGEFKEGYMHGYGIMTFADGHTQKGYWAADEYLGDHQDCDHDH